jgi:hypothetical protein
MCALWALVRHVANMPRSPLDLEAGCASCRITPCPKFLYIICRYA